MYKFRYVFMAFVVLILTQGRLSAANLPVPSGTVILTVSGEIENTNTDHGTLELDLEMLQAMEPTQFTTETIWLPDPVEFTGVSMKSILDYAGAAGSAIGAIALNDYKVDIPTDSITNKAPIVAYYMNGEEMPARGKGPLWVVYPYDADSKFRSEVIYSRSIWQLDRMELMK